MKICLSTSMFDRLHDELRTLAPDAEFVRLRPDGTFVGDPSGVGVFCFSVDMADNPDSLAAAGTMLLSESLEWVQAPGAGVEQEIWTQLVDRGVRLTNAAGVHAEPIAQYVFAHVLADLRDLDRHRRQQEQRVWSQIVADDLTAKTIGIVGMGGIGVATARIAKAFGMRVIGLRRGPIDDPNVDEAFGPDGLHALLSASDFVVLALPLTDATAGLIDAAALAAMRESALLVNVARGGVVDEDALIAALETRSIRGAVLDVVASEPLDEASPLWTLDNCTLTPHDAGYSPLAGERLGRLFMDNLERLRAGEPLRNEIRSTR